MKQLFHDLRAYGTIIADKEHKTTEGHYIRFTTYELAGEIYVLTMCDGEPIVIGERVND